MRNILCKIRSVGKEVIERIHRWFIRGETTRQELYTPESIAIFVQTLNNIPDFQLILGSIIERMSEVTEKDLELSISPRATASGI